MQRKLDSENHSQDAQKKERVPSLHLNRSQKSRKPKKLSRSYWNLVSFSPEPTITKTRRCILSTSISILPLRLQQRAMKKLLPSLSSWQTRTRICFCPKSMAACWSNAKRASNKKPLRSFKVSKILQKNMTRARDQISRNSSKLVLKIITSRVWELMQALKKLLSLMKKMLFSHQLKM